MYFIILLQSYNFISELSLETSNEFRLVSPVRDASPSQVIPPQFVRFPQQFAGTHLYSWVERGTVKVKCLAQEHNTVSPARAQTRSARSEYELTIWILFLAANKHV